VQYPGRQDRRGERRVENLPELADGVRAALAEVADLPLAFFGHSLGATLAFEVARELAPTHLFASGRRAPSRQRPEEEYVHRLDDAGIIAELRRISGADNPILADPELRELFLPVLRSDYRAIETYRPGPATTVSCPITAITGDADPVTTIDNARAWQAHTTGEFAFHVLPGGHFYLEEHQGEIISILTDTLLAGEPVVRPALPFFRQC
jgi:surfactin synthase thioesterase subunit